MKKQKNNEVEAEVVTEEETEVKEVTKEEKPKIKKTIFYIFYDILATICVVLLILTFFEKPREFILDQVNLILGLLIIIYAVIFLLPYTFKKKEAKVINFLTFIELIVIAILGFILITNKEIKHLNISRIIGLIVYIFGLVEIIRGYHSNGGVKIFKSNMLNGLIKYFNIFLITLGTYIFFDMPFDKYLLTTVRVTLIFVAVISIFIGLIKMPKKKKKLL